MPVQVEHKALLSLPSASELRTLPGRVGQSEAASLQVDAAVHQQLPEQERGVSRWPAWWILGGDLWGSWGGAGFGPGHELNDGQLGQPSVLWPLSNFRLLFFRALRAQLTHGGQMMVRGQVVSPFVRPAVGNFGPTSSFSLLCQINFIRLFRDMTYIRCPLVALSKCLQSKCTKPGPAHDCSKTLLILTNKLLSKTKKSSQNTSKNFKIFIWSPFLFSSWGLCSLLWRAVDLNISADALSLTPSLSQALFTLLLGLPSLQLNMDVWFTGRRSVTDHLPLLPSPSFQLHASRPSLTPNLM